MYSAIASRIGQALLTVLLMSAAVFALVRLSPGDPGALIYGPNASPADISQLRERWGLDSPLYLQYLRWVANVFQGDLGVSYLDGRPVAQVIAERVMPTIALTTCSLAIAAVAGVALGLWSGLRPRGPIDRIAVPLSVVLYSTPSFWLGMLLLLVFSTALGLLPSGGTGSVLNRGLPDSIAHLILPAAALSSRDLGRFARLTRATVSRIATEGYVTVAVAKGLSPKTVGVRHVLPNALIPALALTGTAIPGLLGGAIVIETVFSWPGMGRLMIESAMQRNYPVIMGEVLCVALLALVGSLIADIAGTIADPRSRSSEYRPK